MTTDTQKLAADIERVMELDAKRTPGEWYVKTSEKSEFFAEQTNVFCRGSKESLATCNEGMLFVEYPAEDNARFMASATLMADIIRRQQEVIRELRAAMKEAEQKMDCGANASRVLEKALALSAPLVKEEV